MKRARQAASFPSARREPRIQQLTHLHLTYEGNAREVQIRLPDLSPHGMFINVSTHFPEGAVVLLRFRLAHSNVEIRTRAEVRYCLPGVGIGVEFVGMQREDVESIKKELESFRRIRRPRIRIKTS